MPATSIISRLHVQNILKRYSRHTEVPHRHAKWKKSLERTLASRRRTNLKVCTREEWFITDCDFCVDALVNAKESNLAKLPPQTG